YWAAVARAVWAERYFKEHNLVLKASAQLGHHLPFQQEFASGGVNLRGYENMQFRGDTKVAGSAEYSVPFFKIGALAFRGVGFYDTAYTSFTQFKGNTQRDYLPGQTDQKISKWRNGIGAGVRIYVRSVVIPLLGLDFGYGIEAEDYHMYFAVGLT